MKTDREQPKILKPLQNIYFEEIKIDSNEFYEVINYYLSQQLKRFIMKENRNQSENNLIMMYIEKIKNIFNVEKNINNNLDFRCYHDLLHELKHKPNFNAKKFNDIYHSYNIHSYYTINTADFKKKLKEIEEEERKNFQ